MTEPETERDEAPRKGKGLLQQRLEYGLYRVIAAAIGSLSDANRDRAGAAIGRLSSRVLPRRTRVALDNLRLTFPEKSEEERQDILRRCWENFGKITLQFFAAQRTTLTDVQQRVELAGAENVREAMKLGRGIIIVSAHFGNWELAANALPQFGLPVVIVARVLDNPLLERHLFASRTRSGIEVFDRRRAARPLLRAFEAKSMVVMLLDQAVQQHEGILVPFLGRPAWTAAAPARMILRFDVPIIPTFAVPTEHGCRMEFAPAIDPRALPPEERTVEALTRKINDFLSERIRREPEQWLWMHDRWKGTAAAQPKATP